MPDMKKLETCTGYIQNENLALRTMLKKNFIAALVLLSFCVANYQVLRAQQTPTVQIISYNEKLSAVLEKFQQQSGIRLVFANSMVDSIRVSAKVAEAPGQALQKILLNTPFDFMQSRRDFWVIVPRKKIRSTSLRGRIVEAITRQPLARTQVSLPYEKLSSTTDSLGSFEFEKLATIKQKLIVKRLGYQDSTFHFILRENSANHHDFVLTVKPLAAPEVVVEGRRLPKSFGGNLLQQTLTDDQLSLSPLRNDGDLFELLHQQPGVSRRNLHDVFPHLEGGSATEVAVELEGMPIFTPTHGENRRSIFSTASIARVNLHRAGYSAAFGEALSGIIELQTRAIEEIAFSTRVSASLNGFAFSARKNSARFGWFGVGRSANFAANFALTNLKAHDLFNKFEYRLTPQKRLTLLSVVSFGALTQSNSAASPKIWNHSTGLRYTAAPDSAQDFAMLFYRSVLSTRLQEVGMKLDFQKKWSKNFVTKTGLHFFHLQSQGVAASDSVGQSKYVWISFIEYDPQPIAIFNQTAILLSPYWSVTIAEKFWQAQIGWRAPFNLLQQTGRLEPRVAINFTPTPNFDFTFAGGQYHQFTDRNYATEAKSGDAIGAGEYVVRGDDSQPSRATHWRAEASYHPRPAWEMSLTLFRKYYDFHGQQYLYRLNHTVWLLPLQHGASHGMEFWLGKVLGRNQGWLSYTHNDEKYTGAEGVAFRPYFNRRRLLNLTGLHRFSDRWQLKGYYANASGFPQRNWSTNQFSIEPGATPERIAQRYLMNAEETGAHKQLALGLSRLFAGPNQLLQIDLVAANMMEEKNDTTLQSDFSFWMAVHFSR